MAVHTVTDFENHFCYCFSSSYVACY